MPAPKGHPKAGGRKKGTPNKVTSTLRDWISQLIDSNRKQVIKDLKSPDLTPAQRLQFLEKLMQYVIPKQSSTTATVELDTLSDEQLDTIINEITKDIE